MSLHRQVAPTLDRPLGFTFTPGGWIGERVRANDDNWLIPAPAGNDGMVEVFAHRLDPTFDPNPVPWAGEFAGKYLLSAIQSLQLTRNPVLMTVVNDMVQNLLQTQGSDGSLGLPLPWDLWGQYHVMLGLLRWYEFTGNIAPLQAVTRAADLACARYLTRPWAIAAPDPDHQETNQAIAHVLTLLYQHTGEDRYLTLVKAIEVEWTKPRGGNYIVNAQTGREFYQCGQPRWESLHDVQAIGELYYITGTPYYRTAFEQIWRSIQVHDRRITGGFSSSEEARGNPYDPRYIETCGTVAWMALTIDMLRLTGDPTVADELELSLFNAVLGAQSDDGRLWTYHTPMGGIPLGHSDPPGSYLGYRFPAQYDLDWQAHSRYPQLSCCAANGPRGLGSLAEWALMVSPDAVVVNFYGAGECHLREPGGTHVVLRQETEYPVDGTIHIHVDPGPRPTGFTIRLRIPAWSRRAGVTVNGANHPAIPGSYCDIHRLWLPGDLITVTLDLTPRIVAGQRDAEGLTAVLRGPLVLAYDERLNDARILPQLAATLDTTPVVASGVLGTRVLATYPTASDSIALCDFASAGQSRAALPGRPDPLVAWQFSRADGTVLAEHIRLRSDGTIEGYANPNEASWAFDGDVLTFYTSTGAPSTRFTMRSVLHGRQLLRGTLLLDPSIHHVLTQTGLPLPSTWQFVRKQGGTSTILLPRFRLVPGGGFDRPTHPNESRWSMDGETLVFHAADGSVSTRFDSTVIRGGRAELCGQFAFDASIRHVLAEVDPDVTTKIWRFFRRGQTESIDDKVRLLADHSIDGHQHPNERSWGFEGETLVFYDATGRPSTRFTTFVAGCGVMSYEGPFLGNPTITHKLTEKGAGFDLGRSYVVWLRH